MGLIDYIINIVGVLIKKLIDVFIFNEVNFLIGINYVGVVNIVIVVKKYLKKFLGMLLNFILSLYICGCFYYVFYLFLKVVIVNFI